MMKQCQVTVCLLLVSATIAAAPVATMKPKETRRKLVAEAESYQGVPYRYGGVDRSGLDCSGFVYLVVRDVTGANTPRTSHELQTWAEPVSRNRLQAGDLVFFHTSGKFSHVGIYAGDDMFIHAASDGPKTGVILSSLHDPYWGKNYAAAGRIVPPAEFLGFQLALGGGVMGLNGPDGAILRGAAFQVGVSYDILGFSPGLEARPEWDAALEVARIPVVLTLGVGSKWRFFVGPALVIGDPSLGDGDRDYSAAGGLLASGGVIWTPLAFTVGEATLCPYFDLAWQRYEPDASEKEDFSADVGANFRASLGVRVKLDF